MHRLEREDMGCSLENLERQTWKKDNMQCNLENQENQNRNHGLHSSFVLCCLCLLGDRSRIVWYLVVLANCLILVLLLFRRPARMAVHFCTQQIVLSRLFLSFASELSVPSSDLFPVGLARNVLPWL